MKVDLDEIEKAATWLLSVEGNKDLRGTLEYIDLCDTGEAVLLLRNAVPALLECAKALEHYQFDADYQDGQFARKALAKLMQE